MPAEDGLTGGHTPSLVEPGPAVGEPPPGPDEPVDDEPPELAAPDLFCQLSADMLDFLRGAVGLPRLSPRPDRVADQMLHIEARQRLLVPPTGPPVLAPALAALVAAVAAPRLIVTAVQRTLGAELQLQVRVGAIPVLVDVLPDSGDLWCTARPGLDVAGYVGGLLDLLDRAEPEPPAGDRTPCRIAADELVAMRTLGGDPDPAVVTELAGRSGAPAELVRAAANPVAVTHVEVVHRPGGPSGPAESSGPGEAGEPSGPGEAGEPSGPGETGEVRATELVWLDGGPDGLWTVEPQVAGTTGAARTVAVARWTAATLAAELATLVAAAPAGVR